MDRLQSVGMSSCYVRENSHHGPTTKRWYEFLLCEREQSSWTDYKSVGMSSCYVRENSHHGPTTKRWYEFLLREREQSSWTDYKALV